MVCLLLSVQIDLHFDFAAVPSYFIGTGKETSLPTAAKMQNVAAQVQGTVSIMCRASFSEIGPERI